MKNTIYFLVLITIPFVFSSCEENGIFFPTSTQSTGVFEVIFDGVIFTTTNADFSLEGDDIIISAIHSNTSETITLRVKDFDINSFSFEGQNNIASYIPSDSVSNQVWSTFDETNSRGTIQFTSIDFSNNTVSGIFNFIARNQTTGSLKAFTNGIFTNIPISVQ